MGVATHSPAGMITHSSHSLLCRGDAENQRQELTVTPCSLTCSLTHVLTDPLTHSSHSLMCRGDGENQRRELTGKVRQYISQQNASGNNGLVLVDMESAFDYYKLSEQRR